MVNAAVASVAAALIFGTVGMHFREVDQRRNHLAHTFAQDALATLAPNSVLLARGDEVVFPVGYVQAVEKTRPDVTLVAMGLQGFAWYIPQLRRRDPALRIPFDRYDPRDPGATLRALVEANPTRPFVLVGAATDNSLTNVYWLYRRGVVEQVEPMSTDVGLDAAAEDNERLLHSYRLPDPASVRRSTFEISLLDKYERAPASIGDQFGLAHLDRKAEVWYRRALEIDPTDDNVREKLAKLNTKSAR
jgi:hypothetical protein